MQRIVPHLFSGHTDAVLCLQFDDEDVVSGSKDMTIKVTTFLIRDLCFVRGNINVRK